MASNNVGSVSTASPIHSRRDARGSKVFGEGVKADLSGIFLSCRKITDTAIKVKVNFNTIGNFEFIGLAIVYALSEMKCFSLSLLAPDGSNRLLFLQKEPVRALLINVFHEMVHDAKGTIFARVL
jgi:hypothetical protein